MTRQRRRRGGSGPLIERNWAIVRAAEDGVPVVDLAHQHGISKARVYQILHAHGFKPTGHEPGETRARIMALVEEGRSQREVAAEVGVSRARVRNVMKAHEGE